LPLTPEVLAAAARFLGVNPAMAQKFDLTLAEVCDEYFSAQQGKLERGEIRPDTYRGLKSRIADVKALLGEQEVGDLTVERMDAMFQQITLSARSISNIRDCLGAVLHWAVNRNEAPDRLLKDSVSEAAYDAGTSEAKIRANYWKLVSKADVVAYFGIVPPPTPVAATITGNRSSETTTSAG
jgi:hypothetical protein